MEYEIEFPVEWFDGCEVYNAETGEFLGWVNAKKKCVQMIICKEIIHKKDANEK